MFERITGNLMRLYGTGGGGLQRKGPGALLTPKNNDQKQKGPLSFIHHQEEFLMSNIFDGLNFMKPTYLVKTDKDVYHIQASTCSIDTDLKIICFYDKGSVQAMFRVDDVKTFYRIF